MNGRLRTLFGIDVRSLALFRIGLGTLLLVDLVVRSTGLVAHYTDSGVVPRTIIRDHVQDTWRWSVHMVSGSTAYQVLLFTVAAMAAVALIVGYRTTLATCVSWVLLVSIHGRNPLVANGGDVILRMLLFWSIFLPLGSKWSIDNRRGRPAVDCLYLSAATAAILLQVCLMYWMTGYFKVQGAWQSASGFQHVIQFDTYAKPFIYWLLEFPELLPWLGRGILILEIVGPIIVFCPVATAAIRTLVIAGFIMMHLGIELSLTVGLFSYASMLGWILFVPGAVWDLWGQEKSANPSAVTSVAERPASRSEPRWRSFAINGLVALLFAIVVVWNLSTASGAWARTLQSRPLRRLDDLLVFRQKWDMFTQPARKNGWHVVVARLKDGRVVDLLRDGQPADWNSFEKPEYIYRRYPNHRWRKLYHNISRGNGNRCCGPLCRYLARRWNDTHPESEAVVSIELHFMQQLSRFGEDEDRFMQRILHQEVLQNRHESNSDLELADPS